MTIEILLTYFDTHYLLLIYVDTYIYIHTRDIKKQAPHSSEKNWSFKALDISISNIPTEELKVTYLRKTISRKRYQPVSMANNNF